MVRGGDLSTSNLRRHEPAHGTQLGLSGQKLGNKPCPLFRHFMGSSVSGTQANQKRKTDPTNKRVFFSLSGDCCTAHSAVHRAPGLRWNFIEGPTTSKCSSQKLNYYCATGIQKPEPRNSSKKTKNSSLKATPISLKKLRQY